MIDDNLIKILTTLTEAHMDTDRIRMLKAIDAIGVQNAKAKDAIRQRMKQTIDIEDFGSKDFSTLHQLEDTFSTAESLMNDLAAYEMFQKETDPETAAAAYKTIRG